ncbi:hypothetical protein ACFQS1_07415 [Paractinoplanes rhizophilus]|uniref:Uncharacterized protein n=1 Tax=Paractinoplanes rhizophilus TaxID=1416877 RepID=A0ABW2HLV3_9ACTN
MDTSTKLDPTTVGRRGAEILKQMQAHPLWERFTTSSMRYSPCWATYTGMPAISKFDLDRDGQPLLVEAMRALALKAAVYELTGGDEKISELLLPLPVDDMVHAVLAQHTVMSHIERDLGVLFPHDTALEDFAYHRGCDTDTFYAAAGWGGQPLRYWLDTVEVDRRIAHLNGLYGSVGIAAGGRGHDIDFDTMFTTATAA